MEIEIGKNYYFNNAMVTILKVETDDFVLVKGNKDIHTEINGSEFCQECQCGGISGINHTHKCGDAQEIIDEVLDDISYEGIFWVNVKHLKEKPFEYVKWEKITEENNRLLVKIKENKESQRLIEENIKQLEEDYEADLKSHDELKSKKEQLINDLDGIEKKKIVLENIPEIKITNSNLKISTNVLLSYIKDSIILARLESGGVDNWEWYSESLYKDKPEDCEDIDELFENEALETLSHYATNAGRR